jgi:hypothetical protein
MRNGDYGLRTPNFSHQQTVPKAFSIPVDRVEQRDCRREIKAKVNGVSRDAGEYRQAWCGMAKPPTKGSAVKSVSALVIYLVSLPP